MKESEEMQVWFLGQEHPLEKVRTTHPSIPAWEIPRMEEPNGLHGAAELDTTERLSRQAHGVTQPFQVLFASKHDSTQVINM